LRRQTCSGNQSDNQQQRRNSPKEVHARSVTALGVNSTFGASVLKFMLAQSR
jgi:hypothetical protein